jgi:hypothetical protein
MTQNWRVVISWSQPGSEGGLLAADGWHGSMKPNGRRIMS